MSDPRTNHLSADGEEAEENVASYKPLPESDIAHEIEFIETIELNKADMMEVEEDDEDHWDSASTKLLLTLYLQNVDKFRNPKIRKKNIWTEVSTVVGKGPDNCDKKFRNLKLTYIRLLKKKRQNPEANIKWPYFEIFEEIYSYDGQYHPQIEQKLQDSSESVAKTLLSLNPSTFTTDTLENGAESSSHGQNEEAKKKLTNRKRNAEFRKATLEIRERQKIVEAKLDRLIELLSSKNNLAKSKSREKVSYDGAEEKLLQKEKEAKIATRVDMADAKYVVGDHRNGDAKIELDANQKFTGLTREELMKYASDPFWVRLRWTLFVLFWLLWLCMLAGAIAIIVRAPKCAPPPPRTWYERGPLLDASEASSYDVINEHLLAARDVQVQGMFVPGALAGDTYDVLDEPGKLDKFKELAKKADDYGIKLIVDLVANHVNATHSWFTLSENRTGEYADYFVWAQGGDFDDETRRRRPPNNWRSTMNESAWSWSAARGAYYLAQYEAHRPDLNFSNPLVVKRFDDVIRAWLGAGARGVRLQRARQLLVNPLLANETVAEGRAALGADHTAYAFYRHRHSADQPALLDLLKHWAHLTGNESVFTLAETTPPELFLSEERGWALALRPPSTAPLPLHASPYQLAHRLNALTRYDWPILQLKTEQGEEEEAIALSALLPAAPLLTLAALPQHNDTTQVKLLGQLWSLRKDASVQHGNATVRAQPAALEDDGDGHNGTEVLVVVRWKPDHTGYAVLWNGGTRAARADVSALPAVPAALTVLRVTARVHTLTNYTHNQEVKSADLLVPARSALMLSFVPKVEE
ncbi:Maltase 2 [Eumeta japonica]|uniref:alpha-glucosidase n=1 Tax=Eumeta variegata TaxID=151549 RepID=A0A4C1Y116_EUMVA|nr:Maltase 2 [Eumeta japonica]